MYQPRVAWAELGDALAVAHGEAMEAWCDAHRGRVSREEFAALYNSVTLITLFLQPNGQVWIDVAIQSRRRHLNDLYTFSLATNDWGQVELTRCF